MWTPLQNRDKNTNLDEIKWDDVYESSWSIPGIWSEMTASFVFHLFLTFCMKDIFNFLFFFLLVWKHVQNRIYILNY